jgi:hypothetical protein
VPLHCSCVKAKIITDISGFFIFFLVFVSSYSEVVYCMPNIVDLFLVSRDLRNQLGSKPSKKAHRLKWITIQFFCVLLLWSTDTDIISCWFTVNCHCSPSINEANFLFKWVYINPNRNWNIIWNLIAIKIHN